MCVGFPFSNVLLPLSAVGFPQSDIGFPLSNVGFPVLIVSFYFISIIGFSLFAVAQPPNPCILNIEPF